MENEARVSNSPRFGALLRQYRIAAGLSQEALAERARMSVNGVSALERGYRRTPQYETLELLTGALALDDEQRRTFESAARAGQLLTRNVASVTADPWTAPGISALPLAMSSFVGRDRELDEIRNLVRDYRLVTITGAGGVGKTQSALQAAAALSSETGPICFAGFAPVTDPASVATAIAAAVRAQEVPNRPLLETLVVYLRNKPLLLIFDNCEHLITQAASIAATLLRECPDVRILATSREPLRTGGERAYRLPSLDLSVAIALFADRATAVDSHFVLGPENHEAVSALCSRLDGIPLAIELAAARVNLLPVDELAKKLDEGLQVLIGGERTALPRQQTMRATIEWSYSLLSAVEQRVFERLSVFTGGCTLDSATAVCLSEDIATTDVFGVISSLVDKSLVVTAFEGREPRYRLLEPFRDFGREKLALRGEQDVVSQRHADACLNLAEQLDRLYDAGSDETWQSLIREERDNWRAAILWAFSADHDAPRGQRLVGALTQLWRYFAPVEGRRWAEIALKSVDVRTFPETIAALEYTRAHIAWQLREHEIQLASSERAIEHYRKQGNLLGAARARLIAVPALVKLGRRGAAESYAREALAFAKSHGHRRLVAYALNNLCYVSKDPTIAKSYILEAMQIYQAIDAQMHAREVLTHVAACEFAAGKIESAVRYQMEYLSFARETDVRVGTINRPVAAIYLAALARFDEAEEVAREALAFGREQQLETLTAFSLQLLAAIAILRRRDVEERFSAEAAVQAIKVLGYASARLAATGSKKFGGYPFLDDQYLAKRAIDVLQTALGAGRVAKLMADGAAATEGEAARACAALQRS